jgi:molybdopterin synthase sulfur carrier subunit
MPEGAVEVHLFAAARAAVGHSVVTVSAGRLSALLDGLVDAYPGFASVRPRCSYLVDEVAVHDEDVEVQAGSRVDVLPPFAGG